MLYEVITPATDAKVADFMTTDVVTVTPETDVYYVAGTFIRHKFRNNFV